MKSRCLYAICCLKTILDDFWLLKNVLTDLSSSWCVPGICRCKDFTAETIPKNIKGLTRISYLFLKWSTERKLRELSSIRCLTFCAIDGRPIIAENWCVINEFCNRGRDEKIGSFDTILPSKKVPDKISANSLAKGSSIFSL